MPPRTRSLLLPREQGGRNAIKIPYARKSEPTDTTSQSNLATTGDAGRRRRYSA